MLFFFDTSALAKRFQEEPGSATVDAIFDERNNRIFTSRLGLIELTSVAAIKVRTGAMSAEDSIDFLAAVAKLDESVSRAMVVGHNPGLEELLHVAARVDRDFPTAALARIDFEIDVWPQVLEARGKLIDVWLPRDG